MSESEPRRVVITGAGSGMGRATARVFAEEGARVALLDIAGDAAEAARRDLPGPDRHLAVTVDVTDPASVTAAFATVADAFGEIDVAFLAAGIVSYVDDGPIGAVTPETWDRLVSVNMHGAFLTAQAAYGIIAKRSTSSIITVASIAALIGQKKLYAYSAAKGGVLAMSRTLAIEAGRHGVRVNCVCPGAVATAMTEDVLKHSAPVNVLGRAGTAEEVAAAVHGLCAPGAGFLTGATISIDGGASIV